MHKRHNIRKGSEDVMDTPRNLSVYCHCFFMKNGLTEIVIDNIISALVKQQGEKMWLFSVNVHSCELRPQIRLSIR